MKLLLTAGPTWEPIDAVRYLGNRSSGKMGRAIALACEEAGHGCTVILGPVQVPFPASARLIHVETAQQMLDATLEQFPGHDALIMAAAVADFTPETVAGGKIARAEGVTLRLRPTPDIVATAAASRRAGQVVAGFALESDEGVGRAREKLRRKHLDLIVYNAPATMGADDVAATLLYADGRQSPLPAMSKEAFARRLIAEIAALVRP